MIETLLEEIPFGLAPKQGIYVISIPPDGVLGESDTDYSRVTFSKYDKVVEVLPNNAIAIFSSGKLGTLTGGLLHLADFRKQMSADDVAKIQAEKVESQLVESRWGIRSVRVIFVRSM